MLFLFVPIYGAFSAIIVILGTGYYFKKSSNGQQLLKESVKAIIDGNELEKVIEGSVDNENFEKEVDGIIDEKLDDLVLVFKQQIPMGSTFLVGPLVEKLKGSAKKEIIKIVPDMKDRLMRRMKSQKNGDLLAEKLFESITWSFCKPITLKIGGIAAGIGAILGMIQLGCMYLFM